MFAFQFAIWRVIYEELCVHRHSVIFILIVCIKSYDMKNIISLILLFIPFTGLQSQTIRGRVVDSFTYEKLDSVTVSYVDKNDSVVLTSNMRSRRGYQDNCFNTDELVWNMSLSKSIMNGNLTFKLKAYDILNQISSVRYAINAQMQTESWHNMLGRYVMLSVMYRLNLEPKKKR